MSVSTYSKHLNGGQKYWTIWNDRSGLGGKGETHSSMAATLTHAPHVRLTLISDSHLLICSVSQRQSVRFVNGNMMLHITWWFKDVSFICILCVCSRSESSEGPCLQLLDKNDNSSYIVFLGSMLKYFFFFYIYVLGYLVLDSAVHSVTSVMSDSLQHCGL